MSTQKDVAREAGVSIATISRYVNNKDSIKPATRERVQNAVEKLGYRPNLIARSLKLRITNTVALIFADIKDPFLGCKLLGDFPNQIHANSNTLRIFIQKSKARKILGGENPAMAY